MQSLAAFGRRLHLGPHSARLRIIDGGSDPGQYRKQGHGEGDGDIATANLSESDEPAPSDDLQIQPLPHIAPNPVAIPGERGIIAANRSALKFHLHRYIRNADDVQCLIKSERTWSGFSMGESPARSLGALDQGHVMRRDSGALQRCRWSAISARYLAGSRSPGAGHAAESSHIDERASGSIFMVRPQQNGEYGIDGQPQQMRQPAHRHRCRRYRP